MLDTRLGRFIDAEKPKTLEELFSPPEILLGQQVGQIAKSFITQTDPFAIPFNLELFAVRKWTASHPVSGRIGCMSCAYTRNTPYPHYICPPSKFFRVYWTGPNYDEYQDAEINALYYGLKNIFHRLGDKYKDTWLCGVFMLHCDLYREYSMVKKHETAKKLDKMLHTDNAREQMDLIERRELQLELAKHLDLAGYQTNLVSDRQSERLEEE